MAASARNFIKRHKRLLLVAKSCRQLVRREKHDWHVITYEDVFGLAVDWANLLPNDFDCIIGVPRSGLLIANVLATKLGKPLSTADDFVRGIVWASKDFETHSTYKRVLIVEDAVNSARAMKADIEKLHRYDPSLEVKTGCLFPISKTMQEWVDYYYATVNDAPAEWHMHSFFKNAVLAVDLDGVLLDEASGNPLCIPNFKVEAVITARLESDRPKIEAWLKSHNVQCRQLIMFQGEVYERSVKKIAKYKADTICRIGAEWFWESEPDLSEAISRLTGLPVYCPTNRKIYHKQSKWLLSFNRQKGKQKKQLASGA